MPLDPIQLAVINSRLVEIAATMENQLFHSGYSPILRESSDGSAAILDRNGGVVVGTGVPIHLFPYYYVGRSILRLRGAGMRPGDSYLINDPFLSGNFHIPDTAILTPFFHRGELLGFCASIAHKPDMGGSVAGSSSASAREIYHEGMVFPGVRFWSDEGINGDVEGILRRNSRSPDEVIGDLRAQVGCTRTGCERIADLFARYGADVMSEAFETLIRGTERRLRLSVAAWPDGEAEAEAFLDNDGADLERPIRMHVRVVKAGDRITFDYSGSDPQAKGPVNLRPQGAETAAALALIGYTDASIPINDGCRRAIEFVNPEGLVTHATRPSPINNYYPSMHLLYCCVQGALATFAPERAVAPAGLGVGGSLIGYASGAHGGSSVQYELMTPSLGGTSHGDGEFQVLPMSHITPSQPIEILESEYPLEVLRYEPLPDSAGAGRLRGGPGYVRVYRVLQDAVFSLRMSQFARGAWGINGGGAPNLARCVINPGQSNEENLPPLAVRQLKAGDVIFAELAGGGGYGDPAERDPAAVLRDVLDGLVSPGAARERYAVVLETGDRAVDRARTDRLRRERRGATN